MRDESQRDSAELNQADQRRLEEFKEMAAKNIRQHTDDYDGVNLKSMSLGMLVAIKRDAIKQDGHSLDPNQSIDGIAPAGGPNDKAGIVVYQQQTQDLYNTMLINHHDLTRPEAESINSVHQLNVTLREQERQQQLEQQQQREKQERDAIALSLGECR